MKKNRNKNKKNYRKLQSTKNKTHTSNTLQNIGLSIDDPIVSVGIVFKNLLISQLTYQAIKGINKVLDQYIGINIQAFVRHNVRPCMEPKFSVLSYKYLVGWQHPTISTDLNSTIDCIHNISIPKIYYYVMDIEFLLNYQIQTKTLKDIFSSTKVNVICRSLDHQKLLVNEFDINTAITVLPNFDVEEILRIIITENKDVQKYT